MSGEVTVTRAKTWSAGERVDYAKLNETGAPTARVDENAITSTELDTASVGTAVAGSVSGANLARNPALIPDLWQSLDETIACAVGARTQPAAGWFVNPVGASVNVIRSTTVPTDAEIANSLQIAGAASVTTVDIGQFINSWITTGRDDFTLRFYLYNGTGSAFTPTYRIDTASTADDESTTSNATSGNLSECANAQWTLVEKTLDLSAQDLSNGADFVIRIPSGSLDGTGKLVRLARLQITPATSSAPWVHPAPPTILDNLYAAALPTVNDDQTEGYSVGSLWIYNTQVFQCNDAATGAADWQELTAPLIEEVVIAHVEDQATDGGTATSGSWETVGFNTILVDTGGLSVSGATEQLTVSSGTIDLPTGYWEMDIEVPRHRVNSFQARLYDVDGAAVAHYADTSTDIIGTSAYANATNAGYAVSLIQGRIRLASQTQLRVQCQVSSTRATDGCGKAGNFANEIYAIARFRRLSLA